MYIILGGTGHVGAAVAESLLSSHQPVTIVTRNEKNADHWKQKGAQVAVADARNVESLQKVFIQGKYLFLLNPPGDPAADMAAEESNTVRNILEAIEDADFEKIVAQSTYGARPADRVGDFGVLYELEQGLRRLAIPADIVRGAYYMSNWDSAKESALAEEKVYSFFPPDMKLPMVAPSDLGRFAAHLLLNPRQKSDLYYMEGPEYYSARDVAEAFATVFNKKVEPVAIPEKAWQNSFREFGFSEASVASMVAMTKAVVAEDLAVDKSPVKGTTTLLQYVEGLVKE